MNENEKKLDNLQAEAVNEIDVQAAKALKRDPRLEFYGGPMMTLIPFLIFLVGCIVASFMGYANERVFYIICMFAMIVGLILAKDKSGYFDALVDGMTEKLILTAVLCYIFAGAFGSMLKASGLVEGLMWLGIKANLTGGLFCGFAFILGAIYGTSVGSGWATITGLTMFMYPAGIALGANPMVLAGAIISAGCFGDNLAPISDTTIISAATMERPISQVVKSRLPITLIAGSISLVLFVALGGGGSDMDAEVVAEVLATANAKGLLMLIPAALTVFFAFKGWSLLHAISVGMAAVFVIGLPLGLFNIEDMLCFQDGSFSGAIVDGVSGFTNLILLVILATGVSYIMQAGGALEALLGQLQKLAKSIRTAEVINWCIMSVSAFCLSQSVVAIIVGAPLVRSIGDRFKLNRCRMANFCDSVHCMWSYSLPWTGATLLFCSMLRQAAETYTFITPVTNAATLMGYTWHPYILGGIFLFSAITGFLRKFEDNEEANPIYVAE